MFETRADINMLIILDLCLVFYLECPIIFCTMLQIPYIILKIINYCHNNSPSNSLNDT